MYLLRSFLDAQVEIRRSPHPRVELEIAVVRAARRPRPQAIETLIAKVEEAEQRLRAMPAAAAASAQQSLLDAPRSRRRRWPRPWLHAGTRRRPHRPHRRPPPLRASSPCPPRPRRLPRRGPAPGIGGRGAVAAESSAPMEAEEGEDLADAPAAPAGGQASGIDDAWQRVVAAVMGRKALLGSVLQQARPIAVRDGVLLIGIAGNPFLRAARGAREPRSRQPGRGAARGRCPPRRGQRGRGGRDRRAVGHPDVRAVLARFPGEVVGRRAWPMPRRKEEAP